MDRSRVQSRSLLCGVGFGLSWLILDGKIAEFLMSRLLVMLVGAWLVLGAISGCGPELNEEDLGEVQTEASQLPGAGEEYVLPEPNIPEEDLAAPEH